MGDSVGAFAFWLATGGVAIALLTGPIGHAFGRWIDAMAHKGRGIDPEVLEENREQMEQLGARVNELEERLDFAERMLSQQREADRIGKGNA